MKADYLTKPLQGAKFRKFRSEMLNLQPDNDGLAVDAQRDHRSVLGLDTSD